MTCDTTKTASELLLPYPPPSLADFDVTHIKKDEPPFVLVDGSYYLFRCFHGMPPLSNSAGLPTNAIRGVLNALNKLINSHKPTHMAVAFDTRAPTFRHQMSEAYKANRPSMPEELAVQIPYIHRMIEAMGVPLIKIDGYEADDIIGTLALAACREGHRVLISTGDKDMAQLVNECVILEDSFKGKLTDTAGVLEKFGVRPNQIIDFLTLMGDASDGIAGVPKVGQKTATALLNEYNDIDTIIANAENIKGVVGKNILAHKDNIAFDKRLATIITNLELPYDWQALRLSAQNTDWQALYELYDELEFTKEIKQAEQMLKSSDGSQATHDIQSQASQSISEPTDNTKTSDDFAPIKPPNVTALDYQMVTTKAQLDALVNALQGAAVVAIDTETTSKDWQAAKLVGISLSIKSGQAFYIPLAHVDDLGARLTHQLDMDVVLGALAPILQNTVIGKIGQHLKYDCHILKKYGIDLVGHEHKKPTKQWANQQDNWAMDTMLASYVINAAATRHNMDDLAKHYLGMSTTSFEDVAGRGAKQITFDKVALQTACQYACEDADVTFRLYEVFAQHLAQDDSANKLLHHLEIPIAKILTQMESVGILIQRKFLGELSMRFEQEIRRLENSAFDMAEQPFNLASPKQLGEILFDKLGLTGGKKTKTGQYSTSEEVLNQLDHPLVDVVLSHRALSKLKNTYTDALDKVADANNRVHTSYHQALTTTGRLSSSDPNLQNIPIKSEQGRLIRQAFIAPSDHVILAADYSQIELRLMAHFSQDDSLIGAFQEGHDIHKITAAEILGKSIHEVSADERRSAKAVNFGLLYGMSSFGLAKQLGISRFDATEYIKRYFNRYPTIYEYIENTKTQALSQGYVETILGRKIYAPDVMNKNRAIKEAALRAAVNAPLQGSAADIIKLAMIAVQELTSKFRATLLLQVHDELVFEVHKDDVATAAPMIQHAMESVLTDTAKDLGWQVSFAVPLLVEIGVGANWDEAH